MPQLPHHSASPGFCPLPWELHTPHHWSTTPRNLPLNSKGLRPPWSSALIMSSLLISAVGVLGPCTCKLQYDLRSQSKESCHGARRSLCPVTSLFCHPACPLSQQCTHSSHCSKLSPPSPFHFFAEFPRACLGLALERRPLMCPNLYRLTTYTFFSPDTLLASARGILDPYFFN